MKRPMMPVSRAVGRRPRRAGGALTAAALCAAALSAGLLGAAPSAGANPPGPHDPIGSVTTTSAVSGGLRFTGWTADPDALKSDISVVVLVDGRTLAASGTTSLANSTVAAKYHTGPTPGFSITAPVAGGHTACVVGRNVGAGLDTILSCATTPLGTHLTSQQIAAHSPVGGYTSLSASSSSLRVQGWATDPDYHSRRSTVVLYVDGNPTATVITHYYPLPRPSSAGYRSAYDVSVPVSAGMHLGCVWVVNIGIGSNSFLGCKAIDTRGGPGTGTVSTPALNTKVVTEAKKHIGQPYVWGAAGPSSFDCSGLVKYSYGKFGFTTPRVSEAQAVAARLIPASRAVPGDLVFTHDTEGDVYHVGIYVSPGKTVAAIDTEEGVDYQTIWDPSATTYGSFTHT